MSGTLGSLSQTKILAPLTTDMTWHGLWLPGDSDTVTTSYLRGAFLEAAGGQVEDYFFSDMENKVYT